MTDSPSTLPRNAARWSAIALVTVVVGSYYLWELRAAGYRFDWASEHNGYYNYLARAFARGRLEIPIKPAAGLLAAPNPWDPSIDESLKMQDMALFNGRYYLYHGPGPAVMLFTPWLLITGHDLPERFALFLLCFGGFVVSCGALIRWLALAGAKTEPPLLALMLLALGLCQSAPCLLSRVWVYEIAIGGAYFCLSAAIFFLAMGIDSGKSVLWLGASGLMFGLAIACRPHLGLAGLIALSALTVVFTRSRGVASALASRELIAFASAFTLVGLAVAAYNYQRFGDPFEFGLRYLLAGRNQNRIRLSADNILPGLYYWLACPPAISRIFPWIRPVLRYPFNAPFPPEYFIEATVGVLYLAPFAVGALFIPARNSRFRILLWTVLASSAAVLLFLAATGFTTQRYEVDFLPMLILAALANSAIHIGRSKGLERTVLRGALIFSIACGVIVSLALGISGPYNEMLKNRPANYVRLASWFSPVEEFRPMMNPPVSIVFTAEFGTGEDGLREPLVSMGHPARGYFLSAERSQGKRILISQSETTTIVREPPESDGRAEIRVSYAPESGQMTTMWNGREILVHDIETLVTAPAEITIGENLVEPGFAPSRFTGRIHGVVKTVGDGSMAASLAK